MDVRRLKAGLQNQYNRVAVCLLMRDALPSYRHGIPPLNRWAKLIVQVDRRSAFMK